MGVSAGRQVIATKNKCSSKKPVIFVYYCTSAKIYGVGEGLFEQEPMMTKTFPIWSTPHDHYPSRKSHDADRRRDAQRRSRH